MSFDRVTRHHHDPRDGRMETYGMQNSAWNPHETTIRLSKLTIESRICPTALVRLAISTSFLADSAQKLTK